MSYMIRFGAYPLVMGFVAAVALAVLEGVLPPFPNLALAAAAGVLAVAVLERLQPYEAAWLADHGDTGADTAHGLVNFGMLAATAYGLHHLRGQLPGAALWPVAWPAWLQLLAVGAILDFGLYVMHRLSHRYGWAWRLHAIHHSAERLYWLNGERRHPLSALLMAGPGLIVVVTLGAPPLVISAWLMFLAVHLSFQHANMDYRVGPLRRWLGVAETHRWHHKREYEDAQVNFGEFWMVWDRCFGTFLDSPGRIAAGEVGLREDAMPSAYGGQLVRPWCGSPGKTSTLASAFERELQVGYAGLVAGNADLAYSAFERAHVLGQSRTWWHVRSHVAFLRWALRRGDRRELLGQLFRIPGAATCTWLWTPRGNTGGARVSAFRKMPIPAQLAALLQESRR